ncbi:hypothetical protein IV203_026601 [Nitzschia inconspicua]|uniref:Uncharacterized protein n=1 Tax=Nitzschia inconspicua TaxID=303405 RepID=A0A9K3LMK9_9STRA|nr:hypothetical protein IV203_026601 [Nitzschia inconspicua]
MYQRPQGCTEKRCPATVRLCAEYAWSACARKNLVVLQLSHAMRCGMNARTLISRQENKERGYCSQENRRIQMQRNVESFRQMQTAKKITIQVTWRVPVAGEENETDLQLQEEGKELGEGELKEEDQEDEQERDKTDEDDIEAEEIEEQYYDDVYFPEDSDSLEESSEGEEEDSE